MNYIFSHRQRIFDQLLTFQQNIKKTLTHLKYYKEGVDKYYAKDAREDIQRADRIIYRLVNYNYDDAGVCTLLETVLKYLHQVVLKLQRIAPYIAKHIHALYNQVLALLPEGTAIQLELFDVGRCHNPMAEPPVLACVRKWLNSINQWWSERMESIRDRLFQFVPIGEQLSLEIAF